MIRDAFHEGGWGMWPTLLFGLVLVAAALRYAIRPEPIWHRRIKALGVVTLGSGCLGFVTGAIATARFVGRALSSPTPSPIDLNHAGLLGLGESANNLSLALVFVVCAALAATIGTFRAPGGS